MKWGVRRYQNADGSYTSAGRKRYGYISDDNRVPYTKKYRVLRGARSAYKRTPEEKEYGAKEDARAYKYNKPGESGWKGMGRAVKANTWDKLSDNQKKAIKVGAVVAGTALAAYATYKIAGPKIAAYRNSKAIQASVSRARVLLQTGNQNSRNYAKKTLFNASNRTRKAAVDRTFKRTRISSNNVYGIKTAKFVNVAKPPRIGRNRGGAKPTNFRVSGRASTNSTMSRRGINRSYTAKVRSDNMKVKQITAEIMKDHPSMDSKLAERYAWWELRSSRSSAYNKR